MKKWMGLGMSALLLIAALTGCGTTQQETASNEISAEPDRLSLSRDG